MTLVAPTDDVEIELLCERFRQVGRDIVAKGGSRNEIIGRCYQAMLPAFMGWVIAEVRRASEKGGDDELRLQFYTDLATAASTSISQIVVNLVGAIQPNTDLSRGEVHATVMNTLHPMIERAERQATADDAERVTYRRGEKVPFDFRAMMNGGRDGER